MNISIIGAGNVGQALARCWHGLNHVITIGVKDEAKYQATFNAISPQIKLCDVDTAIAASDVIVFAVPYQAALLIAEQHRDWQQKIIIDATNPIAPMLSGLSLGTTTSGAETLAERAHQARVVIAFNTTGAENMANSRYAQGPIVLPVCGDDAQARQQVIALATQMGFDAIDAGALSAARYTEAFAMLWIHLAFKQGLGRQFAFALYRR